MQTDLQRCEWLRQHGWRVEGEAVIDGQPVRWIERGVSIEGEAVIDGQPVRWIERGVSSAWLRIMDGLILWHGAEDQTFEDFVDGQTKPAKAKAKPKTLFGDDDDE